VNGRSQLLVCGAAIKTHLLASAGRWPSIFQPLKRKKLMENCRNSVLMMGVLNMVLCINEKIYESFSAA
jgi:hypothetical protein